MLALSLLCACGGTSRTPTDHADTSPSTRSSFPPPTRNAPQAVRTEPFVTGTFDLDVVGEASGVAVSVRTPGVVYVLDDGPGTTGVLAMHTATGTATTVTVEGLEGRDTEGLAIGACGPRDDRSCLYLGDIGNNQGAWQSVQVWRVREPDLRDAGGEVTVRGDVATFTYPGTPTNAEALLVEAGRPYLVTKPPPPAPGERAAAPRLLGARAFADGRLRDHGALPLPLPTAGGLAAAVVGNVVTGGELAGGQVVLRTYDHVLRYTPHRPGAPLRTLRRWKPEEVAAPALPQGEGAALDACGIWLVSEGVDSVWLVPWGSRQLDDDVQEQACPNGSAPS